MKPWPAIVLGVYIGGIAGSCATMAAFQVQVTRYYDMKTRAEVRAWEAEHALSVCRMDLGDWRRPVTKRAR